MNLNYKLPFNDPDNVPHFPNPSDFPLIRYLPPSDLPDVGVKLDDGKLRMDLIAPEGLQGLAKVLTFGAKKYADRNWEKGIMYGRVFGAMMRHMWAWWGGELKDPETGLSHLHHAAACVHFLQTYEERGMTSFDDRPNGKD